MKKARWKTSRELASKADKWILDQDDWLKSYFKTLFGWAVFIVLVAFLFSGWLLLDSPEGSDARTATMFLVFGAFGALIKYGWIAILLLGSISFAIKTLLKKAL